MTDVEKEVATKRRMDSPPRSDCTDRVVIDEDTAKHFVVVVIIVVVAIVHVYKRIPRQSRGALSSCRRSNCRNGKVNVRLHRRHKQLHFNAG
jgi:hypothetical protein